MPRLLIIDDRDQTVEMCHRHLGQFDYVTRCDRRIPCQVCEERDRGCPMKCAHDFKEAEEALSRDQALPDLVVLDLHFALPEERLLPEDKSHLPSETAPRRRAVEELRRRQGVLILERLRKAWPTLPVVMLTQTETELPSHAPFASSGSRGTSGTSSTSATSGTLAAGGAVRGGDPLVYFCENEVVDSRTLASEITRALALHHSAQEGEIFWGQSPKMAELRRSLGTLARSPLPVLVQGETGTGKSFLAERFIHPRSGTKGPLVITDLSTVPPSLLPAHLFGARRGSYTGAVEDHAGVFEQAHGGTLFLDEIANLDVEMQRQLLLVLERGQVTRLGDTRARPAQVKLVAATNQSLSDLVAAGRFRADLYMRLNPATQLQVPPLRERAEDLPDLIRFALLEALRSPSLLPLVRQFLARFPTPEDFRDDASLVSFGKPSARLARRDAFTVFLGRRSLDRLAAYPWPGNHRELRMLATNALVFTIVEQLESSESSEAKPGRVPIEERAPAILPISDHLIERLVGHGSSARSGERSDARPGIGFVDSQTGTRRIEVDVTPGATFARISADVEKQYLTAIFQACDGDLDRMAAELLGAGQPARKVHLRLNQLGIRLRELRGGK